MSSNIEQSVKDQLNNIAKANDRDFNFICIKYLQERFLARLEKSEYRDKFILKGALLLLVYDIPEVRPSKDIDFLGEGTPNNPDNIRKAAKHVAGIELNDGVEFKPEKIDIERITEGADYEGFRVRISATVGGDHHRLQLDIGFGDTIIDGPVDMEYPTLLSDVTPNIKVYSLESALAEKFEAVVSFGLLGSRMKDIFDIWFLIENHSLNQDRLQEALRITFRQRNTPLSDAQYIFSKEFKTDQGKQEQWQAFLNRSFIENAPSFDQVIHKIEKYLQSSLD